MPDTGKATMRSQRPTNRVPTEGDAAPGCLDLPAPTFRPDILLCDPDSVRASRVKSALSACGRLIYHPRLESARFACQVDAPELILLPYGPVNSGTRETAATLDFLRTFARQAAVLV